MQNCGKHTGGLKKKTWSSTTQEWRSKHTWSFPIQDRCILLASGGVVTPRWHTLLSADAGDNGTSFG
jgi:hypothetical protein